MRNAHKHPSGRSQLVSAKARAGAGRSLVGVCPREKSYNVLLDNLKILLADTTGPDRKNSSLRSAAGQPREIGVTENTEMSAKTRNSIPIESGRNSCWNGGFIFSLLFLLGIFTVASAAESIAVRAGNILTISGGMIENATILVEDGKIKALGQEVVVPDGVRVIDAKNKYVAPGLVDLNPGCM